MDRDMDIENQQSIMEQKYISQQVAAIVFVGIEIKMRCMCVVAVA